MREKGKGAPRYEQTANVIQGCTKYHMFEKSQYHHIKTDQALC